MGKATGSSQFPGCLRLSKQSFGIPALPCLRFERQTGKPIPIFYPENPVSIGDHIRKKRMELKLFQKDVARICGVTEDCIANWEKNRSIPQIQFFPHIIRFLGYLPFEVDLTTLSGKLKAHRHIYGLSQKQLGKTLGVDGSTICSWELGENKPNKEVFEKLEAIFKGMGELKPASF
ncbi:helix-turn-helix domain-containing protein [Pedobacter suwonensis]|uniref:helix-turn-helix domain-containing protein n=1 Tax=Pedobacter suwonensis TaxID=332999 RepID=UPI00369B5E5B